MEKMNKLDKKELSYQIQALFRNEMTLKKLDVSCQPGEEPILDQEDFEAIADSLKINTKLTHLDFSGNAITDEELEYLVRKLYFNKRLQSLNLANTQITSKGLEALVALMFFNIQIVELNLSNIPALQNKRSARSLAVIKQAIINNRNRAAEANLACAA
jgi:hypothetical protein